MRDRTFLEIPILFISLNIREFDLTVVLVIYRFYKTKFEGPCFRYFFIILRKNLSFGIAFAFFLQFLPVKSRSSNELTKD